MYIIEFTIKYVYIASSLFQSSDMTLFPNESTMISFLHVMYYDDILRHCIGLMPCKYVLGNFMANDS